MGKRVKKQLIKFLEMDQLEALQQPLIDKVKKALIKENMDSYDKIAIRDMALLTLVYSCALRISEATNLKTINVNLKNQYVYIVDSKGDDRKVYIPEPTIKVLNMWLDIRPKNNNPYFFCHVKGSTKPVEFTEEKPISRRYYNTLIERLAEETGVRMAGGQDLKKPTPHTLRHTRAMQILDSGAELNVIQKILGHKNIATTQVYANVRQEAADDVQKQNVVGIVNF